MESSNEIMVAITPKNSKTKWVALDDKDRIISEGDSPVMVANDAIKQTDDFSIMFIPAPGHTYIF
jgi:hypothetical protein